MVVRSMDDLMPKRVAHAQEPAIGFPAAASTSDLVDPHLWGGAAAPVIVPDHELLRMIGQGAYGEVWLARSIMGTYRAIKVISRRQFEDERPYEREFTGIQKFEPVSRSHEGLVDILQIGHNDEAGYFYYVMELADPVELSENEDEGSSARMNEFESRSHPSTPVLNPESYMPKTLRAELRRRGRLSLEECITLGLTLTSALGHLHKNGLVHRDIKPSNIIFVEGTPKLADIGLVADIGEAKSFVGTIGYIPPEGPGTVQADLFSLGKVLYEMSTGRDRQDFPQLPPDLREIPNRAALIELNEILLKACDSEPGRRYQSAEEMREDFELLRRGHSIKCRRAWSKRLAACRKAGLWGSLVALAAAAVLLVAHGLPEREMRSSVPEVNDLVAQGNFCLKSLSEERTVRAEALFQRAIELDPTFVPAHFGLYSTYVHRDAIEGDADLHVPLQLVASNLARIAPNLSESRQAASAVQWSNWRFREAVADGRIAAQMPAASKEGRAYGHCYYGWLLIETGKPEAALAEYRLAEEADPASPLIQFHLGHPYYSQGKFDLALEHYQKSIDLEPRHYVGHTFKGMVYEDMGRFPEAIEEFETRDRMVNGDNTEAKHYYDQLREAVRQGGGKRYWERRLELALSRPQLEYYHIATYYARLGDKRNAYLWLNKACEKKTFHMGVMHDLCWDRNDPEFQKIARGMGLLE
jgi:tetratricopeptide (TPR) repeat protein